MNKSITTIMSLYVFVTFNRYSIYLLQPRLIRHYFPRNTQKIYFPQAPNAYHTTSSSLENSVKHMIINALIAPFLFPDWLIQSSHIKRNIWLPHNIQRKMLLDRYKQWEHNCCAERLAPRILADGEWGSQGGSCRKRRGRKKKDCCLYAWGGRLAVRRSNSFSLVRAAAASRCWCSCGFGTAPTSHFPSHSSHNTLYHSNEYNMSLNLSLWYPLENDRRNSRLLANCSIHWIRWRVAAFLKPGTLCNVARRLDTVGATLLR